MPEASGSSDRRSPSPTRDPAEDRAQRILRSMLSLYPASFRRELGADLVETLLERRRALLLGRGQRGGFSFWLTDGLRFATDGVLERISTLAEIGHDARSALRQLRRAPGFHLLVVLTVALGIAASTAMFTVADAVVFRSLPYPDAENLFALHSRFGGAEFSSTSLGNFRDLQRGTGAFSWLVAVRDRSPALTGAGDPERLSVLDVTEGYLEGLAARIVAGRAPQPADHQAGAPPVAVLSWGLWKRRFGGDPGVIGSSVQLDGVSHSVIGVAGPGFRDPGPLETGRPTAAWIPIRDDDPAWAARGDSLHTVLARRSPRVPLEATKAEASRIGAALAEAHPEDNTFNGAPLEYVLEPLHDLTVGSEARLRVLLILGASGLLLVLACVNVANLLLSRGEARGAELSTRNALGASDARIARQLLVESVSLSCLGAIAGLGLGSLAIRAFRSIAPAEIPRLHEVGVDLRAVLFAFVLALVTGAAFGALPALHGARSFHGSTASRISSGRRSSRTQSLLVAVQMALALSLVAGAALLLGSFRNLLATDPGFRPDDLLVVDMRPPGESRDLEGHRRFYTELLDRVGALPGVEEAALSFTVPTKPGGAFAPVRAEGEPTPESLVFHLFNPIQGNLFATLGIPLLAGRSFTGDESADGPMVAVINERAAREFFPADRDPVGRRLALGGEPEAPLREVIGVVGDVRQSGPTEEPRPQIYVPYSQGRVNRLLLALRVAPGLEPPVDEIRALITEMAPGMPIDDLRTMREWIDRSIAVQRFLTLLVTAFGALALFLAVIGTYSTASCAATRRLRELGIRQALGAARGALVFDTLARAAAVAGLGAAGGLVVTGIASRWLEGNLYGLSALDPAILSAVALLLLGAAVFAALGPTLRAVRVDPMRVLGAD
ncbi:MAG TPA: ABC transporter permease [Thermoanaerobaculia bacterium]|nr:ABC transporter permease [Thermoanaerobaculia bacterium]